MKCSQCGTISHPKIYWWNNEQITECRFCEHKKVTLRITTTSTGGTDPIIYQGNPPEIKSF